MKKVIAALMSLIMILTFTVVSFADENIDYLSGNVIVNPEYGFKIYEYTDENYSTVRSYSAINSESTSYKKTNVASTMNRSETDSLLKTREILLSLGLDEFSVSQMEEKQLSKIANAQEITTMVTYTKTDADGNTCNVPEKEAIENSAAINLMIANNNVNNTAECTISSTPGVGGSVTETSEDEYMKMTLVVSYLGNARYMFWLDGEWLTMPNWRSADSLGLCVQGHSIVNSSCAGHIYYIHFYKKGILTDASERVTEGLLSTAFHQDNMNSWSGVAATFDMKDDTLFHSYSSYRAHIEFETYVTLPDTSLNFNVVGTYHHTQYSLNVDGVSVGIDTSGAIGVSIGINTSGSHTKRYVYSSTPYHYNPNS